ncbi:MAG: hypothetical protein ACRD3T_01040 [Terriglobia bacterium]
MDRRGFLRSAGLAGVASGAALRAAQGFVPAHNWGKYDFGSGPRITDRLNQGPFPQYPPEAVFPGGDVVMATTPTDEVVPNFGRGLVTYISGDLGRNEIKSDDIAQAIEKLAALPLGQKLYIRVPWRDVQKVPGRLHFADYWTLTFEMAKKYNKPVGFRVMMSDPDILASSLPDFVAKKVPMVKLEGEWQGNPSQLRHRKVHYQPRYDHPYFQDAYRELNELLAAELNGNLLIEYMDTFMYGFWGEGHTWPYTNNPFPDYPTAERTWIRMFEVQSEYWTKTPLATNTQPDFSRVGNSELVDRTVRSANWLRTDTIFIENMQIESLSNRPPWVGAVVEVALPGRMTQHSSASEGITYTDSAISHVIDVGANYWSLWNFHNIRADNILNYYHQHPHAIDRINRCIGYKVRPSFIWQYEDGGIQGLIVGFANDGIAGVPGALRVYVASGDGNVNLGGSLDPGYPFPGKIRQAQFVLPKGVDWKGLKLRAEIEVKGVRHPVRWACHQKLNDDGSLTLRPNLGEVI